MCPGLPHPFALSVFEDTLFWTDWHTKGIHSAPKAGGTVRTVHGKLHFPMDVKVVHPLRQPPVSPVSSCPPCSHLCLPNDGLEATCACPTGFSLLPDKATCNMSVGEFLVFTRRSDIRRVCLHCQDAVDVIVPLVNLSSAVGLDWMDDLLFWSDVTENSISRGRWDGTEQQVWMWYTLVVVGSNLASPAGLAVDWLTSKLYWTDAGTDLIEVSDLDGLLRTILVWEGLDRPRDILVDPPRGNMYWTDWGPHGAHIERAAMDGTERGSLVNRDLARPNGLALDGDFLYWVDAGTAALEYVQLPHGEPRRKLLGGELPHPFSLAVYGDHVYWTDWSDKSVQRADKKTGLGRTPVLANRENLMDLHAFHGPRPTEKTMTCSGQSPCEDKNGGCSHLCLVVPDGRACACPTGILLEADGRTCAPGRSSLRLQYLCSLPSVLDVTGMREFIVMAHRTHIRAVSLDTSYLADVILPLQGLKNAVALDVDTLEGLPHPFALSVFEDTLFWTDWHTKGIHSAPKAGGTVRTVHGKLHFPMDVKVVHPLRQPPVSPVSSCPPCSHLCLPNDGLEATCACPTGFSLLPDKATCNM
ncbi:LRP4, partial [Cordylochernes scorpioides]